MAKGNRKQLKRERDRTSDKGQNIAPDAKKIKVVNFY